MKISINLLPIEIRVQELKRAKFYKIQVIGVVSILIMIFLTSLTVALRILQSRNISVYQVKFANAQQRVSDLKSTQASLIVLKDRLSVIDQYYGVSSKQSSMYQLIDRLVSPPVVTNSISVDQTGIVTLTLSAPDAESLDQSISNLASDEYNGGNISKVSLESLSRGRDGLFRVGLKITSK